MTGVAEFLIVMAVLSGVVVFVSAPLRRIGAPLDATVPTDTVADLEAARDAKYRELRDADLDHRTGKLSDTDYAELDADLRAEAIEIMRALDRASDALPSPEP
jgi:hypothetical protein